MAASEQDKMRLRSVVRFGMLSVMSFTLNMGTAALLHEVLGVREELSVLVAFVTVFVTNFIACRYFVFESTERGFFRQLAEFALSTGVFRASEYGCFLLLHSVLGVPYLLALLAVIGVSFVVKFVFYQSFVFKKPALTSAGALVDHVGQERQDGDVHGQR